MSKRNRKKPQPSENVKKPQPSENKFNYSSWVVNRWRPGMAWIYMVICIFDFVIAPILTSILITFHNSTLPPWQSLTLSNGGVMHIAFGAILGVAAWGRTREAVEYSQYGSPYGMGGGMGGGQYGSYTRETEYVRPRQPKRGEMDRRDEPQPDPNQQVAAPPAAQIPEEQQPTIRPIPEEPLPSNQNVIYRPGTDDDGLEVKYRHRAAPNVLDE